MFKVRTRCELEPKQISDDFGWFWYLHLFVYICSIRLVLFWIICCHFSQIPQVKKGEKSVDTKTIEAVAQGKTEATRSKEDWDCQT